MVDSYSVVFFLYKFKVARKPTLTIAFLILIHFLV